MTLQQLILMYADQKSAYERDINTVRTRMAADETTSTLLALEIRRLSSLLDGITYYHRQMQDALLALMTSGISHRAFLKFVRSLP
jgi:hypothetical protein